MATRILPYLSAILIATISASNAASIERLPAKGFQPTAQHISSKRFRGATPPSTTLSQKVGLSSESQFIATTKNTDTRGNTHTKYQQTYLNVPVWGDSLKIHQSSSGASKASGYFIKGINEVKIKDALEQKSYLGKDSVLNIAKKHHMHTGQGWSIRNQTLQLVIYVDDQSVNLAYKVDYVAYPTSHAQAIPYRLTAEKPSRPNFIIDAINGSILKKWEGLTHTEIGTGPGGNLKTGEYAYGVDYGYLDVISDNDLCTMENANVKTVNLNHGTSGNTAYSYNCPENTFKEINGAYSPLNDAHFFGNVVFNMFQDWLDIAPLNFQLVMRVHYGTQYENAFWDGSAMTFGDGGDSLYPLVDINVSAHEVSHGFTEQNSGLIYQNQSGGMNEAYSDIAGEAAEYYLRGSVDWLIGADIMKVSPALRYFEDPTLDGLSIGHSDNYYEGMNVHYSSGVFNRAFYLLATSEGWNIQSAFIAFSHANMNYWGPNDTFIDGACGVINSAHDLGYNLMSVDNAFQTVGVDCGELPFIDSDEDGMDDNWEIFYGLNPNNINDAAFDLDEDGLNNLEEYTLGINPSESDSDQDTLGDFEEINLHNTNPAKADTDDDLMPDAYELSYGFDPINGSDGATDSDEDGFSNAMEYEYGSNPIDPTSVPPVEVISFEDGLLPSDWVIPSNTPYGWEISASDSHHGSYSLRSTNISHNQTAGIEFSREFGQGELTFNAKVSSESNFDYLRVYLDDTQILNKSGIIDWQEYQLSIPAGEHTIRFEYTKDRSVNTGDDTAWIDDLRYVIADSDNDGMQDSWERLYGLDSNNPNDAAMDNDEDRLTNLEEFTYNTNPLKADSDSDGLTDYDEIHTYNTNPLSKDSDSDGLNDHDEVLVHNTNANLSDTDNDGIEDGVEVELSTSPTSADSDSDGMNDGWEVDSGLDPNLNDASLDPDNDGLVNSEEKVYFTDPNIPDTDSDGMPDGWEVIYGLNPLEPDSDTDIDADDFTNLVEYRHGTNPTEASSYPAIQIISFEDSLIPDDWTTPNDASTGWEITTAQYQHGSIALKSSSINHSQRAAIEFTKEFSAGELSFFAKVSSEHRFDYFKVYLDEVPMIHISGTLAWQHYTILIPEGLHKIRFEYAKDGSQDDGLDTAWIDNVRYLISDADNDGMLDSWEISYGLNPNNPNDSNQDNDNDSLSNLLEYQNQSDPFNADSDSDGMPDGWEYSFNLSLLQNDSQLDPDNDNLSNLEEYTHNSDPNTADTDGDGIEDGVEINSRGTNPNDLDSDNDGVNDNNDRYPNNPNKHSKDDGDKFLGIGYPNPWWLLATGLILFTRRKPETLD